MATKWKGKCYNNVWAKEILRQAILRQCWGNAKAMMKQCWGNVEAMLIDIYTLLKIPTRCHSMWGNKKFLRSDEHTDQKCFLKVPRAKARQLKKPYRIKTYEVPFFIFRSFLWYPSHLLSFRPLAWRSIRYLPFNIATSTMSPLIIQNWHS